MKYGLLFAVIFFGAIVGFLFKQYRTINDVNTQQHDIAEQNTPFEVNTATAKTAHAQKDAKQSPALASITNANTSKKSAPLPSKAGSANELSLTPADYEEITEWRAARGWFSQAKIDEYSSYDADTVSTLANEGDMLAMQVEANRLFTQKKDKLAEYLLYKAAAHGSTHALSQLALQSQKKLHNVRNEEQASQAKAEWLALKKVELLRGDATAQMQIDATIQNKYYEITSEIDTTAEVRALEIFAQLELYRESLQLEPFDNSTPEKLFEALKFFQ